MDIYECGEKLKALRIGDMVAKIPIIQGGMGVGISRSKLAGAVAAEGGIGIISTAQIGYDEDGFEKDQAGCNLLAIRKNPRNDICIYCQYKEASILRPFLTQNNILIKIDFYY